MSRCTRKGGEGDFCSGELNWMRRFYVVCKENVLGRRVMGGTISLLGDGESVLLNEILCCQTRPAPVSTRITLSKFGIYPTNVLCHSGLARKFADPNTVRSQSLSDVTPILNGISATDCSLPFGSGAQYCRSKRSPLSPLDVPFPIKDTEATGGQKLRLPWDEEGRCIEIGRETSACTPFILRIASE